MNKHIFVEFNAWVYDGSDVLWASLMETLWTAVEREYGATTVRLHRASINFGREEEQEGDVPMDIKIKRRKQALFKYRASLYISPILSVAGIILGLYFLDIFKLSEDIKEDLLGEDDTKVTLEAIVQATVSIIGLQIPLILQLYDFVNFVRPQMRTPQHVSKLC